MSLTALKSAARCPHCGRPMIPLGNGGSRYAKHINECPMNPKFDGKRSAGPRKALRIKLLPIFKRSRLQKIGKLLTEDSVSDTYILICTNCLRSQRSIFHEGRICECGAWMRRAEYAITEMELDSKNLPSNF